MKIAILDDYQNLALSHADWSGLQQTHQVTVFDRHLGPDEAPAALGPFEVIVHIRERMAFPRALIEALPNLKLIIATGRQHRTLDQQAATERGILVCHTDSRPGLDATTPELAWGLILASLRHIPQESAGMAAGGWQTSIGQTLRGRTLGLLGLGRIGRQMAVYGHAFGMRVKAWSSNLTEEAAREGGAEWVSKEDLFRQSDVISIHLVLGPRSLGLVGAPELALMRTGALLVNTSRGPIVQQAPLLAALSSGSVRAALDVYDEEPVAADDPIRTAPNCLLTPHLGYVTEETYRAYFEDAVADIEAYVAGRPIRMINPEAWKG